MEIQSDLIILRDDSFLPLPWSVRGPLGLETGSEVSIALVHSQPEPRGLPDIIVSPLRSEHLNKTYTLDVELGERPGAVADFLTWLGDSIATQTGNKINIALSETITLEGRNKHKMHIVLEPARGAALELNELERVIENISSLHELKIQSWVLEPIYKSDKLDFMLEQHIRVKNGWLEYNGWIEKILEVFPNAKDEYDLTKVVVSSNPQQRLLRFIIPRRNVMEIRVPHQNIPGALREISNVLKQSGYNILSSRLSRTPPPNFGGNTSVFVAACEPLNSPLSRSDLVARLKSIPARFGIANIATSDGKNSEQTIHLMPWRSGDPEISLLKTHVREDIAAQFLAKHNCRPKLYIFLSKRFIKSRTHKLAFDEQSDAKRKIVRAVESEQCAVVEAEVPGRGAERFYDDNVYRAVFSRLWASDACLVLALDENCRGFLSPSIAHEIGFFAGTNRPLKVFVADSRDQDPVFGNIVGKNRSTYADPPAGFDDEDADSLYVKVKTWVQTIKAVRQRRRGWA
jgi:hypothetical protein